MNNEIRFDSYPHFISEMERNLLVDWINRSIKENVLTKGKHRRLDNNRKEIGELIDVTTRVTTRTNERVFSFPQVAFDIQKRIINNFSFTKGCFIETNTNSSNDGMIAIATHKDGDSYKHVDPKPGNLHAVRFNVLLQGAEEGGELFIEGVKRDIKERELHAYMATKHLHWVTKVKGNKSRYMWSFGFHVPKKDWFDYTIKKIQ
jgi:hypothetical protein